jgi:hypothetical protein
VLAALGLVSASARAFESGRTASMPFIGNFESGLTPWTSTGGAAQCANHGVASGGTHYRGTLTMDSTTVGQGAVSARFDLAAQSTYPLEVCDIITGNMPNTLGADGYYGLMVYAPAGFSIGGFGDVIVGLHFVNVYAAPIELVLQTNRVDLTLETGACTSTGCHYRNGSGCSASSTVTCLGPQAAVPAGSFSGGTWYEIITHVHWAADSTGAVQTWYRVKGTSTWTATANYSGIPTEQWTSNSSCCVTSYDDEYSSYTSQLSSPLTIWLDNITNGPSFNTIATTMP